MIVVGWARVLRTWTLDDLGSCRREQRAISGQKKCWKRVLDSLISTAQAKLQAQQGKFSEAHGRPDIHVAGGVRRLLSRQSDRVSAPKLLRIITVEGSHHPWHPCSHAVQALGSSPHVFLTHNQAGYCQSLPQSQYPSMSPWKQINPVSCFQCNLMFQAAFLMMNTEATK